MKIIFEKFADSADILQNQPIPSIKVLPDWYKNNPNYVDGNTKTRILPLQDEIAVNSTIKSCIPFLDAMSVGYMIRTTSDTEVYKDNNGYINFRWRNEFDYMISKHSKKQFENSNVYTNMEESIFKWLFEWHIETPPGYSCLYTHPMNRLDLPFITMSGIVDTDNYPNSVHFPFMLYKFYDDFVIPADTPICQVIPFKRDEWNSKIAELDLLKVKRGKSKLLKYIHKSYKRQFWTRKIFT